MNFLRTKYFKQTSAVIFLSLFVFINALKALHTHDVSLSKITADKNDAIIKSNFSCSICDFQLAKDSDVAINTLTIQSPLHFISTLYYYILPVSTSFAIASDNKGPPAIA